MTRNSLTVLTHVYLSLFSVDEELYATGGVSELLLDRPDWSREVGLINTSYLLLLNRLDGQPYCKEYCKEEEEEKPIDNQADLALCYALGNHIQMICEHNVICTAL